MTTALTCESRVSTWDDEDDGLDECLDGDEASFEGEISADEPDDAPPGDDYEGVDGDDECLPGEMTLAPAILEALAEEAYRETGLDASTPNLVRLAHRLGWKKTEHVHVYPTGRARYPLAPAKPFEVDRCFPPQNPTWALAHVMGHWLAKRHGYGVIGERDADLVAAALLAPRPAFLAAYAELGPDLPALADRFGMRQVGVALRMGEVLNLPIAIVSPPDRLRRCVRLRGPENWRWPDETTLRTWTEQPRAGVRAIHLTDSPGTTVLDASAVTS